LAGLVVLTLHAEGLLAAQVVAGEEEVPIELSESRMAGDEVVAELPSVELHGQLSPAQAAEVFLRANAAYEEGAYTTAAAGYQRLVREGFEDGRVQFNLGNALLRSGELGKAIAVYLRSRATRPRDVDVRANLDFARQSTKDAIEPPEPGEVLSTLFFWHFRLSHRELAIGLLAVNLIFWVVLGLGLVWPSRELIRWASLLLLVLLLTLAASLLVHRFLDRPVAVIVPQEVSAHTAPEGSSVVRFKLHAGTELRVQDRRQGWVRVSLPDGQQGWIGEEWIELVYR
jgi:tetratricopeptide (TPR) repeat protein